LKYIRLCGLYVSSILERLDYMLVVKIVGCPCQHTEVLVSLLQSPSGIGLTAGARRVVLDV